MHQILTINPGSTSTKIAFYHDEKEIWNEKIEYTSAQLEKFQNSVEQCEMRRDDILNVLDKKGVDVEALSSVSGRGGPFKPLAGGTYLIDETVLNDVKNGNVQADHISNIGCILAHEIAKKANASAYFVDPVSVDEFEPEARISGIPEIERVSLVHALNVKATAHKAAKQFGKPLNELNFIIAHLGGGISICPLKKGRIIDVNNANEGGPFSPERAGTLPSTSLMKLCYSGKFSEKEMKKRLVGNGGVSAYLDTNDMREVVQRMKNGDEKAQLILKAMAYQIAKEIGAMAAVLKGEIDAVLLTGGVAHQNYLMELITEYVKFLAPVTIFPGENELESLALGALRVLRGEEDAKKY